MSIIDFFKKFKSYFKGSTQQLPDASKPDTNQKTNSTDDRKKFEDDIRVNNRTSSIPDYELQELVKNSYISICTEKLREVGVDECMLRQAQQCILRKALNEKNDLADCGSSYFLFSGNTVFYGENHCEIADFFVENSGLLSINPKIQELIEHDIDSVLQSESIKISDDGRKITFSKPLDSHCSSHCEYSKETYTLQCHPTADKENIFQYITQKQILEKSTMPSSFQLPKDIPYLFTTLSSTIEFEIFPTRPLSEVCIEDFYKIDIPRDDDSETYTENDKFRMFKYGADNTVLNGSPEEHHKTRIRRNIHSKYMISNTEYAYGQHQAVFDNSSVEISQKIGNRPLQFSCELDSYNDMESIFFKEFNKYAQKKRHEKEEQKAQLEERRQKIKCR